MWINRVGEFSANGRAGNVDGRKRAKQRLPCSQGRSPEQVKLNAQCCLGVLLERDPGVMQYDGLFLG